MEILDQKRLKREERKAERRKSDIKKLIQLPEGRRILRWIIVEKCGTLQESFRMETNLTNYNLGRQSIGRDLLNDLNEAKGDAFMQIQQEHESELKNESIQEEKDIENTSVIG